MKKTEMKVMGKIGMEIAKLAVLWQAVIPWASDILEYDWDLNEQLVSAVLVGVVSFAGYLCVTNVKNYIAELKLMKEERKNSKKQKGAKSASSLLFLLDIYEQCWSKFAECRGARAILR